MNKLRTHLNSPLRRYVAIGISVYAFELLVIVTTQAWGASSVVSVAISFWLGLAASFALQKIITFGDKRLHHKILLPQLLAFSLLVLFNFSFTIWLTSVLDNSLPAVWCRTIALAITTIWNFYFYKTRIFAWKTPAKSKRRKKSVLTKRASKTQKNLLKTYRKWRSRPSIKKLRKYAGRPEFGKWYLGVSLFVLFTTTVLWSMLGAHLQRLNADQLVNARLFDGKALHDAFLPEQHSFLIKWPLFYIIKLLDYTPSAFLSITVLSVVLTVAAFVYILWRIERRPLALGSLCLMLASVLLLVPTQPYAGALLPVNMAMLATRNLEYVLYIAGLVCLAKAASLRSKQFVGAVLLLGLLIASDKLFLSVSIAGSLLALLCYILYKRWNLVNLAVRWLLVTILSAAAALLALGLINYLHITNLVGSQTGPYGFVQGAKSLLLGVIFAISGLLTNFGANPAFDATTLRQLPTSLSDHLLSPAGPAYIINAAIFALCMYAAVRFFRATVHGKRPKVAETAAIRQLSILMLWSGVAMIGLFVITNHYYQVDARYLTLCLFTLFILLAGWLRPRRLDAELVAVCAPILLLGILLGSIGCIQLYSSQKQALDNISYRNKTVAFTLDSHHVKVLVGDYWRVLPVQSLTAGRNQKVMPLENCALPRNILSSKNWQPDLHHTSFAYLLSFDKSQTDYPQCTLDQVITAYGVPNSSALIDGSLSRPKELLLFYDRGIHFPRTLSTSTNATRGILPIALDDLVHTACNNKPTVMNIVAHEDDDLLFMNPDLQQAIDAKHCVRSIYLTAGDAGGAKPYWLSRELGSEAAYSEMTGSKAAWRQRIVKLQSGQYVTVANLRGNNQISLVFMHLPDGNIDGRGFGASHHASLEGLEAGRIDRLRAVDDQSSYTRDQLINAIAELMRTYQPAEIRTQSDLAGRQYKDHSDHRAAGRFAARAYEQFNNASIPLAFYLGYPVRDLQPNISGEALRAKEKAFDAYGLFDGGVCHTHGACPQNPVYDIYLARQYRNQF